MGNQLAAATAVNVADVSSSLQLVAPLGGEHRNYFRSFHCTKLIDNGNITSPLRSRNILSTSETQENFQPLLRRHLQWSRNNDVVVKVFVRTIGDNAQRQLVEFCYDYLISIYNQIKQVSETTSDNIITIDSYNSQVINNINNNNNNSNINTSLPCNILFYTGMEIQNDRFCMLERPFIAFSLSERFTMRPYWDIEMRLFVGYQLLQSLVQLHEVWNTIHGDLKTDNVMLDTSGWLYITDLSPFKPALLPANNPALFDYYYDTNETRKCFLSPEKFVDQPLPFNTLNVNANGHTKAMDIFSAGCVLAHIFTEEPLFFLSDVLGLRLLQTQREREVIVERKLTERGISCHLSRMLLDMLCTSSNNRPSARELLEKYTPLVFPAYFDFIYRDVLPPLLARPPDLQIQLLYSRLEDILEEANRRCKNIEFSTEINNNNNAKQASVLLLLPIILNASIHLITADAFCKIMYLIQKILPHCPMEVQIDTILPYILHYIKSENNPIVARILALRTLSFICHSINFSISEATMFDDLALPCIEDLIFKSENNDASLLVEVANQLPGLLLLARIFLEKRQALASANSWQNNFGEQVNFLIERGWNALRLLYKHNNTTVVVAILRKTKEVVQFLGEERTQDELIPFLTTAIASAIDVQRELYPQAILCHLKLESPKLKTLSFFVDEGLRQTDIICLQRTIDSIAIIVESKCLPVWDVMPLVHQALPHIMNSNNFVSFSTCKLVEKVARIHRISDVYMYLECGIRPLLRHYIPLSRIASFPTAVKLELSNYIIGMEQSINSTNLITRVIGGDTELLQRILRNNSNNNTRRELQYTVQYNISKRNLNGLTSRVSFVDISFDPTMINSEDNSNNKENNNNTTPWKLSFKPTSRESKRIQLRQQSLITNKKDFITKPFTNTIASPDNLCATGRRIINKSEIFKIPPIPNVTWSEKEIKPIAAPWFSQKVHLGAIYSSSSTLQSGIITTAGARGEAILWSLGENNIDYSHKISTGASVMSTFLFTNFIRDGLSPLLSLGGTDGIWRLLDVKSNNIIINRNFDDSALTSACTLGESSLSLISSAKGGLFTVDDRVGKEVWQIQIPAALGAISGVSPLFHNTRAYGVSAVTLHGNIALFDLRFQMLLKEYSIGSRGELPFTGVGSHNPNAIFCVCPDIINNNNMGNNLSISQPGVLLLGTQAGTVHRLHLSTGETSIALQPANTLGKSATRALLIQPKYSNIFTAGNDMLIRKWSLTNPAKSMTLACPPYTSPTYMETTRGGIAEVQRVNNNNNNNNSSVGEIYSADLPSLKSGIVPRHHEDAILTLCAATNSNGETFLASGDRDGTLTVWFNSN